MGANRVAIVAAGAVLATAAIALPAGSAMPESPDSLAPIVRRAGPAVVYVYAERGDASFQAAPPEPEEPGVPEADEPELEDDVSSGEPALPPGGGLAAAGVGTRGSGFIVDPEGLIVTNEHVVAGAERVHVRVSGGENAAPEHYPAEVLGADARTNLALLRIEPKRELPGLRFADSDEVEPGDWVVAVADRIGHDKTVASGIVRARGAATLGPGPGELHATEMFETGASMRPEESGGPLLDLDGNVIGVTIAAVDLAAPGIAGGFATPSNVAADVIEDLKTKGRVERGTLGIVGQGIPPEITDALEVAEGILVAAVEAGGPAAREGVEAGDVILRIDDTRVRGPLDLAKGIEEAEIGETVVLELLSRSGERRSVELEVAAAEEAGGESLGAAAVAPDPRGVPNERLGVVFAPGRKETGVVVDSVEAGSAAEDAGIVSGDAIERVFSRRVATPRALERALSRHRDDRPVLLLVRRGDQRVYLTVPLDDD